MANVLNTDSPAISPETAVRVAIIREYRDAEAAEA